MSSFGTYLIGFIILILGLAIAAFLLSVPTMQRFDAVPAGAEHFGEVVNLGARAAKHDC